MLGRDPLALVDHRNAQQIAAAVLDPHPHRRIRAAIFERVHDQVAEQLDELRAIAQHIGRFGLALHRQRCAARRDQLGKAGAHLLDHRHDVDRIARRGEPVRLDPRQRHEIVDQAAHPRRLVQHDAKEAVASLGVSAGVGVLQGLDEAEDRGERRTQFVACIGDEIGAHLLGGAQLAEIGQPDQPAAVAQPAHDHRPGPARILAEADQLRSARPAFPFGARARQLLGGGRMTDRKPDVLPFDMGAEQRARRVVGRGHAPVADQQHRFVHRAQELGESRRRVPGWRLRLGRGRCWRRGGAGEESDRERPRDQRDERREDGGAERDRDRAAGHRKHRRTDRPDHASRPIVHPSRCGTSRPASLDSARLYAY